MQAVGYQGSNNSAPKTFRALPVAYELGKYILGDENAAARVVSKAINVATRPCPGSPDIDRQETQFLGVILQLIAAETHSDARPEEVIIPLYILDFEQRAAIVLRDVMGFSREYAARAMNVSPETYAAFLSEGRRQLRDHLARVGLVQAGRRLEKPPMRSVGRHLKITARNCENVCAEYCIIGIQ